MKLILRLLSKKSIILLFTTIIFLTSLSSAALVYAAGTTSPGAGYVHKATNSFNYPSAGCVNNVHTTYNYPANRGPGVTWYEQHTIRKMWPGPIHTCKVDTWVKTIEHKGVTTPSYNVKISLSQGTTTASSIVVKSTISSCSGFASGSVTLNGKTQSIKTGSDSKTFTGLKANKSYAVSGKVVCHNGDAATSNNMKSKSTGPATKDGSNDSGAGGSSGSSGGGSTSGGTGSTTSTDSKPGKANIKGSDATCWALAHPLIVGEGEKFTATASMTNTGGTTWSTASGFRLSSQTPQDNSTWGASSVALTGDTAPNATATVTISATAPKTPGSYSFDWKMIQDGKESFGATCTSKITVTPNSTCSAINISGTGIEEKTPTVEESSKLSSEILPVYYYLLGYNSSLQDHFFTAYPESEVLPPGALQIKVFEVFKSEVEGTVPIYRFYGDSTATANHYFAMDSCAPDAGYHNEGVAFYAYPNSLVPGSIPVYEAVNSKTGGHFYTADKRTVPSDFTVGEAAFYVPSSTNLNKPYYLVPKGTALDASVTMTNTGATTWTTANKFELGSQNAQDNSTWGLFRVPLTADTLAGGTAKFDFKATAPKTAGTYNFDWAMIQGGVTSFGETCTKKIKVTDEVAAPDIEAVKKALNANDTFAKVKAFAAKYKTNVVFDNAGLIYTEDTITEVKIEDGKLVVSPTPTPTPTSTPTPTPTTTKKAVCPTNNAVTNPVAKSTDKSVTIYTFGYSFGDPPSGMLFTADVQNIDVGQFNFKSSETGLMKSVSDKVMSVPAAQEWLTKMKTEWTPKLTSNALIAIGCSRGHHRSVTLSRAYGEWLKSQGYIVNYVDNDISRAY